MLIRHPSAVEDVSSLTRYCHRCNYRCSNLFIVSLFMLLIPSPHVMNKTDPGERITTWAIAERCIFSDDNCLVLDSICLVVNQLDTTRLHSVQAEYGQHKHGSSIVLTLIQLTSDLQANSVPSIAPSCHHLPLPLSGTARCCIESGHHPENRQIVHQWIPRSVPDINSCTNLNCLGFPDIPCDPTWA